MTSILVGGGCFCKSGRSEQKVDVLFIYISSTCEKDKIVIIILWVV